MASELAEIESGLASTSEPKAKRQKLKPYDLLSAQMHNSMGASGVETIGLEKLAIVQAKGNKVAPYFTELCDENEKRKGIAMSRLAEVQLKTGAKLCAPAYKMHINAELYEAAMKEFNVLKPHFEMLMGKDIQTSDGGDTVGSIVYSGMGGDFRNDVDVNTAAKKVYEWLQKPKSKWRSLVVLLSAGGLFYTTAVHEKSHRAYIAHGENAKVSESDYQKWCRARLCGDGGAVIDVGDLDGL